MVGVYYRPPDQEEPTDEDFFQAQGLSITKCKKSGKVGKRPIWLS